jgi:hypothetical protein
MSHMIIIVKRGSQESLQQCSRFPLSFRLQILHLFQILLLFCPFNTVIHHLKPKHSAKKGGYCQMFNFSGTWQKAALGLLSFASPFPTWFDRPPRIFILSFYLFSRALDDFMKIPLPAT